MREAQVESPQIWCVVYWVFAGVFPYSGHQVPNQPRPLPVDLLTGTSGPGKSPDMAPGRFPDLLFNGKIVLFSSVIQFCPSQTATLPSLSYSLTEKSLWLNSLTAQNRSPSEGRRGTTERIRIQGRGIEGSVWMTTNVSLVLIWLADLLQSLDQTRPDCHVSFTPHS